MVIFLVAYLVLLLIIIHLENLMVYVHMDAKTSLWQDETKCIGACFGPISATKPTLKGQICNQLRQGFSNRCWGGSELKRHLVVVESPESELFGKMRNKIGPKYHTLTSLETTWGTQWWPHQEFAFLLITEVNAKLISSTT